MSHSSPSTSFKSSSAQSVGKRFIGAVKDEWQLYSDNSVDYTIGSPIGFGASSIVYSALYRPSDSSSNAEPIPCALKVLDLDSLPPRSLQLLQKETTLMSLSKHPNVLRVRGSWMDGHKLYIALRLMNKGSAADVMRYGWPGGMEEDVCRCILAQALKGLNYLHINGFIHRDVKAANLLIDDDGTVLLGDLGVAADLSEDTSHNLSFSDVPRKRSVTGVGKFQDQDIHSNGKPISGKRAVAFDTNLSRPRIVKRKSFVGTPCWMAPELIQGRQYDSSADIWSFGITALELTQGRPPRSRESPQSVLLRTIQDDPPTLDRESGTHKYSRAFKEVVDSCLVKDPSKRPSAEELLQTPFFKAAKKKSYLVNAILKDLPPLTQRQERRVANSNQSLHSLDSWDFATTINSPTTSVYRRRLLEDIVATQSPRNVEEIFEMEDEHERQPHGTPDWNPSHRHFGGASWVHENEQASIPEETLPSSGSPISLVLGSEPPSTSAPSSPSNRSTSSPSADVSPQSVLAKDSREEEELAITQLRVEAGLSSGNESVSAVVGEESSGSLWLKFKNTVRRPRSRSHSPSGRVEVVNRRR